jgi:flavin reductase (DIM6/NTAB) family NADH-FMN oxidoreductase RutF
MKPFPLSRVYALLEPGPVLMVTTHSRGITNVMTMSWHTMIDFEPPLLGCIISNRDYTFELIKASRECVLAIPTVELAPVMAKVGNTSGRTVDKFKKFKIATAIASRVQAPLLPDCAANLECKVTDISMINRYNLFVLTVVKAWINPAYPEPRTLHHLGRGLFMVAGRRIKLPSRMK